LLENPKENQKLETIRKIVQESIEQITPYAKKKGVTIDQHSSTLRFYGYSQDSAKEIQHMLVDLINKKFSEEGLPERVTLV
jgi:hypothetical protein